MYLLLVYAYLTYNTPGGMPNSLDTATNDETNADHGARTNEYNTLRVLEMEDTVWQEISRKAKNDG
jgi:hypothetical protein